MDAAGRSSSNDLSSAPNSDTEGPSFLHRTSNTITVATPDNHKSNVVGLKGNGGVASAATGERQDVVPKQRKPRKKKDSDAASTPVEKKEKGIRRPRGASTAAGSTRKKVKTEIGTSIPSTSSLHNVSTTQAETVFSRPIQQHNVIDLVGQSTAPSHEAAKFSQNGFSNNNSPMMTQTTISSHYNPTPPPLPPPPAPIIRGPMVFDPVRSLTHPRHTEPPPSSHISHANLSTPPRNIYNPSTSPAISSIINPPDSTITEVRPSQPSYQPLVDHDQRVQSNIDSPKPTVDINAMEIDPPVAKSEFVKKSTPETVPAKPTTKPRAKEQPPPLPTGSGLLSSSLFGGDSGMDAKSSNDKGTSIVLHIDLKNPTNKVINFARLAEEKYGFAALYPRQAAQKERLAKVAAAGAALERAGAGAKGTPAAESGDEDVSVDIDRDSDNDGDIAMSGMNGTGEAVNSGTDGPVPKRRKRKDEYDADDPFVDDSELLWEAQAAASKDGFFVYCGPLVPEGEKPTVERADGTVKRGRGRGRGGGPGSRGGRGAAAAARDVDGAGGGGRGGGPGSRGGGITRKPRITKAERAQRELEKKQREQMAVLAAKPPNYQP